MTPDWSDGDDPVPYADPEDPQSLNLYAYTENNPTSVADDDGHYGRGDWDCETYTKCTGADGFAAALWTKHMGQATNAEDQVPNLFAEMLFGFGAPIAPGLGEPDDRPLSFGPGGLIIAGEAAFGGGWELGPVDWAAGALLLGGGAIWLHYATGSSGPKAADAPGVTAGNQATNRHGQKTGPSGKPQVNNVDKTTREAANNAANKGAGTIEHTTPRRGQSAFPHQAGQWNEETGQHALQLS